MLEPSYRYPTVDPATDGAAKSAVMAAGGTDASTVYLLADNLYYVLVNQGGAIAGSVVRGVKKEGLLVWAVLQTHEEPAEQEELERLVAQVQSIAGETPEEPTATALVDSGKQSGGFPAWAVVVLTAAATGAGVIGAGIYFKKKKDQG